MKKLYNIIGILFVIAMNTTLFYRPEWLPQGSVISLCFFVIVACIDVMALVCLSDYLSYHTPKRIKCKRCGDTGLAPNKDGTFNRCDCYYEKHL